MTDLASRLDAIVKAYDIRGLVPEQLDEPTAAPLGSGFAAFLSEEDSTIDTSTEGSTIDTSDRRLDHRHVDRRLDHRQSRGGTGHA